MIKAAYNKSLLPTAYVASAPSAATEFKRQVLPARSPSGLAETANPMFKVILIEEHAASYRAALTDLDEGPLPDGDVIVRVSHSTLNYKYALAIMTRQGGPRLTSKPCAWRSAVHPAHS